MSSLAGDIKPLLGENVKRKKGFFMYASSPERAALPNFCFLIEGDEATHEDSVDFFSSLGYLLVPPFPDRIPYNTGLNFRLGGNLAVVPFDEENKLVFWRGPHARAYLAGDVVNAGEL